MRFLNSEIDDRVVIKLDKSIRSDDSSGIMLFGEKNDYPQIIEKLIMSSQTAKAARNVYAEFIAGDGFENEQIGSAIIGVDAKGKDITLDSFRVMIAKSLSMFNGAYAHCNMNANGEINNVRIVPFKNCRFTTLDDNGNTGKVAVYENWQKDKNLKFDKEKIKYYFHFNKNQKVIESQIEKSGGIDTFKGQIYSLSLDDEYLYPLSPFDSVNLDCDTEYQLQIFKNRQTRNGFLKKAVVMVDPCEDDEEREKLTKDVKSWQGIDGDSVIVVEAESFDQDGKLSIENALRIQTIDSNIDDKLFDGWEKSLANNIRKAAKALPAVLIDYEQGKLSSTSGESIREAVNYYNSVVESDRNKLSEAIKEIFSSFNSELLKTNVNWAIKPKTLIKNGTTGNMGATASN